MRMMRVLETSWNIWTTFVRFCRYLCDTGRTHRHTRTHTYTIIRHTQSYISQIQCILWAGFSAFSYQETISPSIWPWAFSSLWCLNLDKLARHQVGTKAIHTHTYTYIHTYLLTYIHTYIHTYILTYLHTYIPTYLHTYILTYMDTWIHGYMDTWIHGYMDTWIHGYIDI